MKTLLFAVFGSIMALMPYSRATAQASPYCRSVEIKVSFSSVERLTWSNSLTVEPGQEFFVRIGYDNRSESPGINASIIGVLPNRFTLVPGTTRNCITPSSSETVCNTDAGQAGGLREESVWCDGSLTISPTAGLYDVSPAETAGILEIGKKRYLNFLNCDYALTNGENTDDLFGFAPGNSIRTDLACGEASGTVALRRANSSFQPVDILGRRYANFQNCDYMKVSAGPGQGNTDDLVGFAPANRRATISCGNSTNPEIVYRAANSSANPGDLLGRRFVNFQDCDYALTAGWNTDDVVNISPSNSARSLLQCGYGGNGVVLRAAQSKADPVDLLDTSRGAGFIEFRVRAPSNSGLYTQGAQLRGDNVRTVEGFGTIRVQSRRNPTCRFCS